MKTDEERIYDLQEEVRKINVFNPEESISSMMREITPIFSKNTNTPFMENISDIIKGSSTLEEVVKKMFVIIHSLYILLIEEYESTSSHSLKEIPEKDLEKILSEKGKDFTSHFIINAFPNKSKEELTILFTFIASAIIEYNRELLPILSKPDTFKDLSLEDKINAVLDELNQKKSE